MKTEKRPLPVFVVSWAGIWDLLELLATFLFKRPGLFRFSGGTLNLDGGRLSIVLKLHFSLNR